MKLVEFSVERYRSIIKKSTVTIKDRTVIIGPNNEGKSNVLRALVVALRTLEASSSFFVGFGNSRRRRVPGHLIIHQLSRADIPFDWTNDYPHSLLGSTDKPEHLEPICFNLLFEMNEKERKELSSRIRKDFDRQQISFSIKIDGTDDSVEITNNFETTPSDNSILIANYITRRINICYIDAVRTASTAYDSIRRLLSIETENIDESKQYQDHLKKISKLYRKKFQKMSSKLTDSLKTFVPSIIQAKIEIPNLSYEFDRPLFFENRLNVLINDGEDTPLKQKGSGIQSLIALALAHTMSVNPTKTENFILAIEEPEAHLHPKAIHEIKRILFDIAKRNQLIITTHSPLLANLNDIESNIIVSGNTAKPAHSIKDIRDTLGSEASDNLLFAYNNIFVEGESDERILKRLLPEVSPTIKAALENGTLFIINCHGASKISSFVSLTRSYICKFHIVLDNDAEGKRHKDELLLGDPELSNSITLFSRHKMKYSEVEDLIKPTEYIDRLLESFQWADHASLLSVLKDRNVAWSERLIMFSDNNGHPLNDEDRDLIKEKKIVADVVVEKGLAALCPSGKNLFVTLARNIERMLEK